jgi:hypothetical protein
MGNNAASQKPRYAFLDLYRGMIVLFMLEGHVLRELLEPTVRLGRTFQFHELFHGITAPGFLFSAGFTFAVATQRRWEKLISLNPAFLRRAWRPVMLLLIGYALHVPFLSLQKNLSTATVDQWNQFVAFDALQCIGFSLLTMRLWLVLVRGERAFLAGTIGFFAIAAFGAPVVWNFALDQTVPLAIASALNGQHGSLFPIFPYAAYVFAGSNIAWHFLRASERKREGTFIGQLALGGAVMIVGGVTLDTLPFQIYEEHDFWTASPNYFFIKLGLLILLLCGLWKFEELQRVQSHQSIWMPRWLTTVGVESLFVYIVHLILLYGWVVNPSTNVRSWFGLQFGWAGGIMISILFVAFFVPLAFAWHYLKKYHPVIAQGWYWWIGIAVGYSFFVDQW